METKELSISTFFSGPEVFKVLDAALKNFNKPLALLESDGHKQLQMCLCFVGFPIIQDSCRFSENSTLQNVKLEFVK